MTSDDLTRRFSELVHQLFAIFAAHGSAGVLDCPLPRSLHQDDPATISNAYFTIVLQQKEGREKLEREREERRAAAVAAEEEFKEEEEADIGVESVETTTMTERYTEGYYSDIYRIYHDLRLASIILISQEEIGSETYHKVDFFYKVSVELLMRETHRLGLPALLPQGSSEPETAPTPFEAFLAKEYYRISTAFTASTGQAYMVASSQHLPLFTSLVGRSDLDQRVVPTPESFHPVLVVPHRLSMTPVYLSTILPDVSKIPGASTEIMPRFFHPNWFSLPIATWLQNRGESSFAPTVDESGAVISNDAKTRVWLEQMGAAELDQIREAYMREVAVHAKPEAAVTAETPTSTEESPVDTELEEAAKGLEAAVEPEIKDGAEATEGVAAVDTSVATEGDSDAMKVEQAPEDVHPEINMVNLFEWCPGNTIDDDEIDAAANNTEQELANRLLIDLHKLRHKRLHPMSASMPLAPSTTERELYFKIRRLLASVVGELAGPGDAGLEVSKVIPVLQTNYPGTLPAPVPVVTTKARYIKTKRNNRR